MEGKMKVAVMNGIGKMGFTGVTFRRRRMMKFW